MVPCGHRADLHLAANFLILPDLGDFVNFVQSPAGFRPIAPAILQVQVASDQACH